MIIANPIYDVVFKRLMEDMRIAKCFIGTLLDQTIETVEVKPQEYTYEGEMDLNDPITIKAIEARVMERITIRVYRLDFIATIKTESGELKKVLIEIQKAGNQEDLMRFRNYLGEQYKKEDSIDNLKVILPITTIYILGFDLPEITSPCIKVERNYKDLIEKKIITIKSDFVEKLTHDSYIVQVKRITGRYQTRLDKLLSVFEQRNFIDDTKIIKEYIHATDIEEVKIMTDTLHHAGTNPVEKKKIEVEQEAWRTMDAMTEGLKAKTEKLKVELNDSRKVIAENELVLNEKDMAISKKDLTISNMAKQLEELKRKLGEK